MADKLREILRHHPTLTAINRHVVKQNNNPREAHIQQHRIDFVLPIDNFDLPIDRRNPSVFRKPELVLRQEYLLLSE